MKADDFALKKIQNEYEKHLVFPQKKPGVQFILCPVGLPGSGKTTVIKPLAEHLSLLRISNDEIRWLLTQHGYNWDRASELGLQIGEKYARQGYSIAADSDCAGKPDKIRAIAKSIGARIVWIHINPSEEFIINNLARDKHSWLYKDKEDALHTYYDRKKLHTNLDFPFVYIFDTSRNDFPLLKQIEEAEKAIVSSLLP